MGKNRMEAFSDGVFAIIITIMVLELKVPQGHDPVTLRPLIPVFLSYLLSFVYVGIYWNNHHHLMYAARRINGGILWANLHLLFWLSLLPFVTGWMGENHFVAFPVALYGAILLMAGVSYRVLAQALLRSEGRDSLIFQAIGKDHKGILSIFSYATAIPLAFVNPWASSFLYVFVALIWLIPDRRIERLLSDSREP